MNYKKLIPIAVALGVLGAACSDEADPAVIDSASVTQEQPGAETSAPADGDEGAGDVEGAERSRELGESTDGAGPDEASGLLGSTTGQLPSRFGDQTVPLTIDVTSLERSGEHVELQMTLTVDADDPGDDFDFCVCDSLSDTTDTGGAGNDISGVRLIGQAEQMAYLPIVDSEGVCVCSNDLASGVAPSESIELSATFGGIPADLAAVDLEVPGFSSVSDLSLQG